MIVRSARGQQSVCCCHPVRRERCGGQGYLSVNRFGELIGFAHAGMTAEGDNRCADGARLAMSCAKR
jgi:hypothetical protein